MAAFRITFLVKIAFFGISQLVIGATEKTCPHPAVPLYSSVTLSNNDRTVGTIATYECDEGYELFGESTRACLPTGEWSGVMASCAVNVAYGKPANQSSSVRGGDASHGNDGDLTTVHENRYCTETKAEDSPWWQVDLLHPYPIQVVRLVTRGCCGHQPLQDLEIRVGNSSTVQGNRLCAWYPKTLDDGVTKDFDCAYPIVGRYVYVQMVGIQGSLTVCEVMVFTTQEISSGRCGNQLEPLELTTFSRTCYEFQVQKGGSYDTAEEYCRARGGLMLHGDRDLSHHFIASELERRKDSLKSKLVWLGAQRDQGLRAKTWHWVDGSSVQQFLWAEDQPNNYNGQQNCIVLDGGRKWLWNDVTCDLDYLPWVCQYRPSNCGNPDRQENSTISEKDFRLGQSVTYQCPTGNKVVGDRVRRCESNGFWSGTAPTCQYVNCGDLRNINFGVVTYPDGRTTYNATALYVCQENYTLVGNGLRRCAEDDKWNGTEPRCEYHWCQRLKVPANATMEMTGVKAGDEVKYTCDRGHKLVGDEVRKCQLGGQWTGRDPICKYVDCGRPLSLGNGTYRLLDDGLTTYQSRVTYKCNDNYTIAGHDQRSCLETGKWSGREPTCSLIDCGKPDVPEGASIPENATFTVHSEIPFRCKAGYKLSAVSTNDVTTYKDGGTTLKCNLDGKWSGSLPTCIYVDCGRVQPLLRGEVQYANGTTHLASMATYNCNLGFRIIGPKARTCMENGKWSESAPKCEEIRCVPPEVPKNATVVYGGNDRASADSFRVGSTVQYRCIPGHLPVKGEPLRTCLASGDWSTEPPACMYIDCGFPRPVPHGHWLLPSNTTFYGSQAEYVCDVNYEIHGPRRRLCLENATWSNAEPSCEVVACAAPDRKDDQTLIEGDTYIVENWVNYRCSTGYEVIGNSSRVCGSDGKWSGETPSCKLVDCSSPSAIANGQGFLSNGTTTYRSVVQYRCLPDFQMVGESSRTCLETGEWSGLEPKCVDIVLEIENTADGRLADGQDLDASKTIGIAVAVGAGALLIIIIIAAAICVKTRKAKAIKNASTTGLSNRIEHKDTSTIRAYPSITAITASDVHNGSSFGNGAVRNNPNGLVTFSSNPQPIYANVNGHRSSEREENGIQPMAVRQLRNGVIQSESL
ncbi:P-selectin isoform X1 [Parasteatoda tepidariorum]|uniref:P-selectin isoform X2 n=1 Tax=Parasteatoda tepidariorum TaxID=114398 RepID=UPI001C71B94E|nr:CUB and sushi domain-containing protein 1 isoform X1 [Parasteatoda tepidariorum]XP_042901731.1 CUB and sushi domain-containing protein 1 isoform X2 [Parasteatoda tepidariorum]